MDTALRVVYLLVPILRVMTARSQNDMSVVLCSVISRFSFCCVLCSMLLGYGHLQVGTSNVKTHIVLDLAIFGMFYV